MAVNDLPADWNKPCSEKNLAEISQWISDWRGVAPFLGLTKANEHQILGFASNSVPSQRIEMLRLWKEKRGRKATYKRLCRAFTKCKMRDLVEKVQKLLTAESSSSSSSSSDEEDSSSNSNPLASYASYLKELYESMSSSHTSQHWTHLPRCEFIQLAMIGAQAKEARYEGQEEEMIRLLHLGKIETVLNSHKKPIELCKLLPFPIRELPNQYILEPPPPQGRVLLIEGAPGGGKSSLALHICHQWAQGESWMSGYDIVILAYLRDQAVQNAKTLADILPARTFKMSESVASRIQATDGSNALFVFDGWDEFPPNFIKDSLVSTTIYQPYKLSLHRSTVLITSRPVASGNLLHIADRRVEILGFTQKQIRDYIEKALDGNITRIQKLVQHLEDHPVIEGYCYVPLHVAILVHIFLTMKEALPTTLHELFCSLVLCCIVREHETHEPDIRLPELMSLDDLPVDFKTKLSKLSILAYNGVMKDKIVFYLRDLREFHLPTNLPSLGLLQVVEGLTLTSKASSYNFLHLSVQELLAAYHISRMAPSEQVEVFKKLFVSSRFQAVLHYYCGFTKLNNPEVQKFVSSYQRNKSNFTEVIPLLHCFLEAQQQSLCQLVDTKFIPCEHDEFSSENFSPVDLLAIGYFIASLLFTSDTANTSTVHLSIKHVGDHHLKLLLTGLSKYSVAGLSVASQSKNKLALKLNTPSITHQGAKRIASLLNESSFISKLTICDGEIQNGYDNDGLLYIAEALQTNSSLTCLNLRNMNLQHTEENGFALAKMIRLKQSLTHLDLSHNPDIFDTGICCYNIFEDLQHITSLIYLSLNNTGITTMDADTAKFLYKMLQMNKSLKHLDLSNNEAFSDSVLLCIFEGLQNNTTLVYLSLRNTGITTIDADTAGSLNKMLQMNKSLTHIDLSDDFFAADDLLRLEHNKTLPQLVLSGICITDDAAGYIGQILISSSLQILDINECTLGVNGIHYIFDGLRYSTSLKQLYISENCILMETFCEEIRTSRKEKGLSPIEIITPDYWPGTNDK